MTIKDPYTEFESALVRVLADMRKQFGDKNISELNFSVHAHGLTQVGDLKVTFRVANYVCSDDEAKGGHLKATVEEFLRRKSWAEYHAPLTLPKPENQLESPSDPTDFEDII